MQNSVDFRDPAHPYRKLVIISKKELIKLVPYTATHIGRLERAGKFPKRLQLGECRVGWLFTEVEAWIEERIAKRTSPPTDEEDNDLH
jgi:prophage regulatory protein